MITENKLHHILGVARKAYQLAKDLGYNEEFARNMFVLGWTHDIAYEFDDVNHPEVGMDIMYNFCGVNSNLIEEIGKHGFPMPEDKVNIEYLILNCADLTVSPEGKPVTIDERIKEVGNRIDKNHPWYTNLRDTGLLVKRKFKELYNMDV